MNSAFTSFLMILLTYIMFTCQMFHMVTSVLSICSSISRVIMSYITGLSVKSLFMLLISEHLPCVLQVKLRLIHKFSFLVDREVYTVQYRCTFAKWVNLLGVILSFNGCPCLPQAHFVNHKILISAAAW